MRFYGDDDELIVRERRKEGNLFGWESDLLAVWALNYCIFVETPNSTSQLKDVQIEIHKKENCQNPGVQHKPGSIGGWIRTGLGVRGSSSTLLHENREI
jgi:hypothetical protein